MTLAVSILLAAVLGCSALLKARRSEQAASAFATYGIAGLRAQRVALWSLVALELAAAVVLAVRISWAPAAAAVLFAGFAAVTLTALLAGRGGRPCACFGGDTRLGWSSPARAGALAALAAALALGAFPGAPTSYDEWLTVGFLLSLATVGGLALAVLALAREVGVLRLGAGGGRGALEIAHEGPALGEAQPWALVSPRSARTLLRLAVFTSDGCPLCRQVAPAVEHVAGDPVLEVRTFDEALDAVVWREARVPGSPYAVALSVDGVALAKGAFNSLAQLESILATARRREREEIPLAA
ncbi:MAG TPA: MauE/DoxX family redox-associated membrane protein [Solirubrobacteraceae bacterium]|jgi:hypothetical protein